MKGINLKTTDPIDSVFTPVPPENIGDFTHVVRTAMLIKKETDWLLNLLIEAKMIKPVVEYHRRRTQVHLHEDWIVLFKGDQLLAEMTLCQRDVLPTPPGFSEDSPASATDPQRSLIREISSDSLTSETERERLQLVVDDPTLSKVRAGQIISYFKGNIWRGDHGEVLYRETGLLQQRHKRQRIRS